MFSQKPAFVLCVTILVVTLQRPLSLVELLPDPICAAIGK